MFPVCCSNSGKHTFRVHVFCPGVDIFQQMLANVLFLSVCEEEGGWLLLKRGSLRHTGKENSNHSQLELRMCLLLYLIWLANKSICGFLYLFSQFPHCRGCRKRWSEPRENHVCVKEVTLGFHSCPPTSSYLPNCHIASPRLWPGLSTELQETRATMRQLFIFDTARFSF